MNFGELWGKMAPNGREISPIEVRLGFMGRYEVSVDQAGRVAIPTKFREILLQTYGEEGSHVVLAPIGPRIKVFPVPVWMERVESELMRLSRMNPLADQVFHLFYNKSVAQQLDSQSRVRIPSEMIEELGLGRKVFVTGQKDYMEIWPPEKWREAEEKFTANYEKTLAELFGGRPKQADA
ncbi:MAG: hypothetical protein D6691_07180 [Candidatus Hydrogenedentota bacterium]|nr:MAG: hypothetical protein D6691_07180 [Candidatus Hydrogenedentota bacterium]